jgi:hypothetical protein
MPVFAVKMRVDELDADMCSSKFLRLGLRDDEEVYVKCAETGELDLRGKSEEYRIMSMDAVLVDG